VRCARKDSDTRPSRKAQMLTRLADVAVRRRTLVLVLSLFVFLVAGALGGGVAERLSTGGFDNPGSESGRAAAYLRDVFKQGDPEVVLVVHRSEERRVGKGCRTGGAGARCK